jgi:cobalt/nickel transport system permease protein
MLKFFLCITLLLIAAPAHAMHISEGILPLPWAVGWFAVAVPFVALGIRQLNSLAREDLSVKPLVGLMAAVVFIISCMPVPVPTAGTCSHPCGTGMAAILLGPWISTLIAAVALLLQALFLSHGGLSTWGANIFSMGVIGSLAGYLTFKGLRTMGAPMALAAFFAGLQADWATYLTTSVELASGIRGSEPFLPLLEKILIAFVPTQLPLGILEGAMTAGMVMLLYRKRPDILVRMRVLEPGEAKANG